MYPLPLILTSFYLFLRIGHKKHRRDTKPCWFLYAHQGILSVPSFPAQKKGVSYAKPSFAYFSRSLLRIFWKGHYKKYRTQKEGIRVGFCMRTKGYLEGFARSMRSQASHTSREAFYVSFGRATTKSIAKGDNLVRSTSMHACASFFFLDHALQGIPHAKQVVFFCRHACMTKILSC